MAEITDSKTRQQNQQAHLEYLERLKRESQQAEEDRRKSQINEETLQALNELQINKYNDIENSGTKPVTGDATDERMKRVREKLAPIQTWGGIAGMPIIAKDSFAPMFSGTKYAENAREYLFNRRISRTQSSARVDKDEATRLVGRLDPSEVKGKSKAELTQLARDKYFARSYSPLNEAEAVRFADIEIAKMAKSGGLQHAQQKFLGIKPTETPKSDLQDLIKQKAISDFHSRQNGVRGSLGKILYGDASERHSVLKKLPIDLSNDTVTGRAVGAIGQTALAGASALPALSVGLGSAAQFQKLQKLRRNRDFTGGVGKVAEGATTASGLIRAGIFGPAATLMAAPAFGAAAKGTGILAGKGLSALGAESLGQGVSAAGSGIGNLISTVGQGAYRTAKDSAFGLTSMLGGGALKMASAGANMLGGNNVNLGASLAGAAKGVGFGASMAGMTPALVGGLALALPGIIGSITGHMADKKRRISRGFKQPTDKLIKQFSRSLGIDTVIRNLFSTNAITSDRMLELQMLMYIEQNTSSIPKMVADTGLLSDRKEKDGTQTIETHGRHQREAVESAYESDWAGSKFKRRASYAWNRGLADVQRFTHSINLPGQIADLLINRKTPFARKEEFRRAREDAKFQLMNPANLKKASMALNTSAGHVQLMGMSAARLVRSSGAQSVESQQLALQAGIFDLLRLQFRMVARNTLRKSGTNVGLTPRVAEADVTGFRRILHSIPGMSSLLSAYEVGEKGFKAAKSIPGRIRNTISDIKALKEGTLQLGQEKSGIGRFLSKKVVGSEQLERFDAIAKIKEKMGLTKTNSEKIETFQLKLPEYWEELLDLNRQSIDALRNIFNVNNRVLSYVGSGDSLTFEKSKSERRVFDYASGESLTQKHYNRIIADRRDTFDKEIYDEDPKLMTRMFRKVFGGRTAKTNARQKSIHQFSTDDDFRLSDASQSYIPPSVAPITTPLLGPGPGGGVPLLGPGGVPQIQQHSPTASNPCCPEVINCCNEDKPSRSTILGPNGLPARSGLRASGNDIPIFRGNRSATMELDEAEVKERERTEAEFRKSITDGLKNVIDELKKLLEEVSKGGSKKEKGEGFFSKLGGLISGAFSKIALLLAPLIAALTPLIAPLAAVAAGLGALVGFNKFGKNSTWTGAAVDTVQDLGMMNTAITKAPQAAVNVSSKVASGARGVGSVIQAVKEGQTVGNAMTAARAAEAAGSTITGPGKIAQAFTKGGEYLSKGITSVGNAIPKVAGYAGDLMKKLPVGLGTAAKGIGKVASVASKANPALLVADAGLQLGQDVYDPTRINKRYEDFKEEMSNSGMLGKAWGLAKKVINPYEGGSVIGSGINKGIDWITEKTTGEKGATLGGKIYDWMHGDEKKAQDELLNQKLEANKKMREERLAATSTTSPSTTPSAATPPVINVKTETLETKTEEQTDVLKTGLSAVVKASDDLLAFFKGVEASAKETGPVFNTERKQWIKDQADKVSNTTAAVVTDLTEKIKAVNPKKEPANFGDVKQLSKQAVEKATVTLRKEEELPTVKEVHRKEQQVRIPTHSSAPSAINAGMAGSKSQEVKDRPINPMIDGFIDQLFTNTINVFQQSIKSFAIGQTPFQILR